MFKRKTSSYQRSTTSDAARRSRSETNGQTQKRSGTKTYRRTTTVSDAKAAADRAQAEAAVTAPTPVVVDWAQVAPLVYQLWRDFFRAFREDERNFERESYLSQVTDIHAVIYRDGHRHLPNPELGAEMLRRLVGFQRQRFHDHRARHETLTGELRQTQHRETEQNLTATFQRDELGHTRSILLQAAADRGIDLSVLGEEPKAWRIAELLLSEPDALTDPFTESGAAARADVDLPLAEADDDHDSDRFSGLPLPKRPGIDLGAD